MGTKSVARHDGPKWKTIVHLTVTLLAALSIVHVYIETFSKGRNMMVSEELPTSPTTDSSTQSSWVPRTKSVRCEDEYSGDDYASFFKSQSEEDKELLRTYFKGLCGGSYIEMGAENGIYLSNSYYFNKVPHWKGLLIEANPASYAELVQNRKTELVPPVHAAVCKEEKDVHWISFGVVGGIVEFAAASFQDYFWNEETRQNAKVVRCLPLQTIISETIGLPAFFDFFSLDVEGAELEVLKSLDFDTVAFGVIFHEKDGHNPVRDMAIRVLLESHGYIFINHYQRSDWFVHPKWHEIYEDVLYDDVKTKKSL